MATLLIRIRPSLGSLVAPRLAVMIAALAITGPALAQTPLDTYDATIAADALFAGSLTPAATFTTPVILNGASGAAFDFGDTSGDVTMEFILKGNPAASASSTLAIGTNTPDSRLDFEVWDSTLELGFTQGGVADYQFTPGVPSPTNDTHITYVWDSTNKVMSLYVNGTLAGSASGVDGAFVMPSGWGWLGANNQLGDEGMSGTIYRVTVYNGILPDDAIRRHSSAFGARVRPALSAYDTMITSDSGSGLVPSAKLSESAILNGSSGADFDFGPNSGGAGTMEFILEGDPSFNNSAFLAIGENNTSSLRYEAWDNTGQLGFTKDGVSDYQFSPGVASPTLPTHLTFAWNPGAGTMKLYVNGALAGTTTAVTTDFGLPYGPGRLGDNGTGSERLRGTIYRVTVYTNLLSEADILRHGKAFGDLVSPPTILSFTATPATIGPGTSSTLSWQVKDTLKVFLNGVEQGSISNVVVSPVVSTRYTLTAQNALGATTAQIRLLVSPDFSAYDAAIIADATGGLVPLAKLTNPVSLNGTGVPFNFGTNTGDATMEFILEGDPNPGSGTSIATDYDEVTGFWRNSLRYSQWPNAWQLGFTKKSVDDYTYTPLVPSPNWPTHLTFVWDSSAAVASVYVNGSLAGQNASADPSIGLPTGLGTLGGDGMLGAIFRVTSYAGKVSESKIRSHSKAFLSAARPALNAYDNAIETSALTGLNPIARLFAPEVVTGAGGVNFNFGTNTGDATMEFVLEGDPTANAGSLLAVATGTPDSGLVYELSNNANQLGFAQASVAEYALAPAVASPTNMTHITYRWSAGTTTMKVYVNGTLAGTTSGVSGAFVMPVDAGVLGDSVPAGKPMVGTIHRVTVYNGLEAEAAIQSHAAVFAGQAPKFAVGTTGGVATMAITQGIPGAHYRAEYRNTLSPGDSWQLLQDIPALVGTSTNLTDPNPIVGHNSRYYRAVLLR